MGVTGTGQPFVSPDDIRQRRWQTPADATMPFLAYDSLLGVTLESGLNYQRKVKGETVFSVNAKTLLEFLQLAGTEVAGNGSDGTNTWIILRVRMIEPLILKSEDEDELSFTVADNLDSLLHLKITAGSKIEVRDV